MKLEDEKAIVRYLEYKDACGLLGHKIERFNVWRDFCVDVQIEKFVKDTAQDEFDFDEEYKEDECD